MSNPNPSPENRFKKGHPNLKLPGTKNKATLLKEKLIDYALKLDLDESRLVLSKSDKRRIIKKYLRSIPKVEILRLAAGMVPKEIKGEGFDASNLTAIFAQVSEGDLKGLIAACREGAGPEESA